MLTRHQQNVPKPFRNEVPGLLLDLINLQCHPLDGIFPRESAIRTGIDALIREIQRGKKPHGLSKMPSGQRCGVPRKFLQPRFAGRFQQAFKRPQRAGFVCQGLREDFGKGHEK